MTSLQYTILTDQRMPQMLALEEYLVKEGSRDLFVIWTVSPSVVVGKYQEVRLETRPSFLKSMDIGLYRRYSGGGSVFIDEGTLLYTYVGNRGDNSFEDISKGIQNFLATLGIETEVDHRLSLFHKKGKISGVAQAVHKRRQLFHGTILVQADLQMLELALRPELLEVEAKVPSVRSEVTNIGGSTNEVIQKWGAHLQERGISRAEDEEIRALLVHGDVAQLRDQKYSQEEWIMGEKN